MKLNKLLLLFSVVFFSVACGGQKNDAAEGAGGRRSEKAIQPRSELKAIFTCAPSGSGEVHFYFPTCLSEDGVTTNLEMRVGNVYDLYGIMNYEKIGRETSRGFVVNLGANGFEIKVQNASKNFILGLVVMNEATGEVVFQKKVARFGVISVKN